MAATSSNDKLFRVKPRWTTTIGSGGVADDSTTTIPLSSVSGLNNGEAYVITMNRVNSSGEKQDTWETAIGTVSGTNLINCSRGVEGTASAWGAGTVVEILMTAEHWNRMVGWAETEHNQDGTHKTATVTTLKATGAEVNTGTEDAKIVTPKAVADSNISFTDAAETFSGAKTFGVAPKMDTIDEKTAGAGVTIDNCLIKDGNVAKATVLSTTAKARAYPNANQSIPTNTNTKVILQTEDYDPGDNFADSTFTAPVTGYYSVSGRVQVGNPTAGKRYYVYFRQNTSFVTSAVVEASDGGNLGIAIADILYLTAGDTLSLYFWHEKGSNETINNGADAKQAQTCLAVHLIST